ncbi:MAG TPA: hypothetical protein VF263_12530, partial [Longimicrobiaceae bacterium]
MHPSGLLLRAVLPALLLALPAAAQQAAPADATPGAASAAPRALRAGALAGPVVLDGVLDDAAWAQAEPAREWTQQRPRPGAPASQRSEARVLYDAEAVYVGMRLYDTAPDSVAATLGRRDYTGYSDWAQVV